MDDFVKGREELGRAHQQYLLELERAMQEPCNNRDATDKRWRDEIPNCGAFSDANKVDWTKERQRLVREAAGTGHEKLGWDGKQRSKAITSAPDETHKDYEERFVVSNWGGDVALKRVVDIFDEGQGFWMAKDDPRLSFNTITDQDPFSEPDQAVSWLLTDDYSPLYLDQTLPYKLHPSFYKSDANDSYFRHDYRPGDLYPRFASNSILRHDPCLASRVHWRAAFHDLLDVHHKGTMSPPSPLRNQYHEAFAWTGVGNWIASLIDGGSLGPGWRVLSTSNTPFGPHRFRFGKSSEAWVVPQLDDEYFVRERTGRFPLTPFGKYDEKDDLLALISRSSHSANADSDNSAQPISTQKQTTENNGQPMPWQGLISREQHKEPDELDCNDLLYPLAFTNAADSPNRSPDTEQSTPRGLARVLQMIENLDAGDEVKDSLLEALAGTAPLSPKKVETFFSHLDRLLRNDYDERKAVKKDVDSAQSDMHGDDFAEGQEETPRPLSTELFGSQLPSFSSPSSCSNKYASSSDGSPKSVISTLTTVENRTLPDGSIETKRTLKKRFADGGEESSESTEIQPVSKARRAVETHGSKIVEAKDPESLEPPVASRQNDRKARGWFWN